ncbi:MAG: hypothetical protein HOI47_16635 [Candidatus Scalindua sp.]|jgi:hypothetical protein|nr:hypothetical protein [Cytophagia bacterium]MBT6046315.1 hypothetical protein [Candidatus Scalindua sp.]MBT6228274.1 hypothetical protein [Candidatus Scalindua sp.]
MTKQDSKVSFSPKPKKNKGIAIQRIKETLARGEKFVTDVSMSGIWYKEKKEAVQKLLSGNYGNKVEFSGASKSFYATYIMPDEPDKVIEKIRENNCIVYIVVIDQI